MLHSVVSSHTAPCPALLALTLSVEVAWARRLTAVAVTVAGPAGVHEGHRRVVCRLHLRGTAGYEAALPWRRLHPPAAHHRRPARCDSLPPCLFLSLCFSVCVSRCFSRSLCLYVSVSHCVFRPISRSRCLSVSLPSSSCRHSSLSRTTSAIPSLLPSRDAISTVCVFRLP